MRFQLGRLEFGRLDALVWAVTALTHAAGLVHDGNSGGGLTRRHVRSIADVSSSTRKARVRRSIRPLA